jgi:hypothetical protein
VKKRMAATIGATVIAGLLAAPASAAPATPQVISVSAFVSSQDCLGGDFVMVTLSADVESSVQPVGFRWDLTNNGSFDTPLRGNPMVQQVYPDEINVTARVLAVNAARERATDTVSFATLRCEG